MKIFIYDEFAPEDMAMMQALYSRSADSVEDHVEKVKEVGSGKFMERYYVGYGHASIADCGSTTVFIEDVSMLAAKAVQDWPLYSGQETSSRYIDMGRRKIIDPIKTKESQKILKEWIKFYTGSLKDLEQHLREKYIRKPEENENIYNKAISARAYDILRGFLPAGITTQLSWHTNLRQAHDKLSLLRHHPLTEIRKIAEKINSTLQVKYAHSFGHKLYKETEEYRKVMAQVYTYYKSKKYSGDFSASTNISNKELVTYKGAVMSRPPKTSLPIFLSELGNITFDFLIDFGSFRDIQRHRNGVCRMPLLTTKYGFNEWYVDQLPPILKQKAKILINSQKKAIDKIKARPEDLQYLIAMGFNVSARTTYGLPAAIYTMELRSGSLVHPTLRKVTHKMHHFLRKKFPKLKLHTDLGLDDWDIKRGTQDIKEKTL